MFIIDPESDLVVYCALENGELLRYQATVMACLPMRISPCPKSPTSEMLADDFSTLAIWNAREKTIKYFPIVLDSSMKIKEIGISEAALIFYNDHHQAHMWNIDNEHISSPTFVYDTSRNRRRHKIQVDLSCDAFCFTQDGEYLFGVVQKESLLFMYQVNTGQRLEKLVIENLSPHI